MAKSVTGERIIIPEARLAFPDIWEARSIEGGQAQFGANLILAPNSPAIPLIRAEEARLAKLAWPDKADVMLEMIRAKNGNALHNGLLKAKYDGFDGNFYVSANLKTRPTIVDRDGSQLTPADGRPYSGCYVLAHISLWTMDNQYGQKINVNLLGLQFLRDGDAFSGGAAPSSTDDFKPLDADEGLGGVMD
jgi:hypothetical protein